MAKENDCQRDCERVQDMLKWNGLHSESIRRLEARIEKLESEGWQPEFVELQSQMSTLQDQVKVLGELVLSQATLINTVAQRQKD
jgi:hypothetical protein